MLAMEAQSTRGVRLAVSSLTTIASKLAPTGVLGCSHMLRQADAYCRSEHARDGGPDTAGCQVCRVIVSDHREQARSYRGMGRQKKAVSLWGRPGKKHVA